MKKVLITVAFLACSSTLGFTSAALAAGVTPCEDVLKEVRAAMATAKLTDAQLQQVKDLEAKGIERCNADDDKRADSFFSDALKIMGKG